MGECQSSETRRAFLFSSEIGELCMYIPLCKLFESEIVLLIFDDSALGCMSNQDSTFIKQKKERSPLIPSFFD